MRPRLSVHQLRKLIAEETFRVLSEVGEKEKEEKGEDSVDGQIDKYLIQYEKDSRSSKNEAKDFRHFVKRFLIEAEGEEDEDKKEDKEEKEEKLTAEDIDVQSFVDNVARLVDNYDALLEIRNAILRRSVNFLVKGYEADVSQEFKDSLAERYDMYIGKTDSEVEDEEYQVPYADRAGPMSGGT